MANQVKPVVIKCETMWAQLQQKNQMSGKYQVDLSQLSSAAVTELEKLGLSVRNDKEGMGNFITCKSINPIRAFNTHGDSLDGVLIGNGSKAKAVVGAYDWRNPAGKEGRSPSLLKLVIDDLVTYQEDTEADYDLDSAV